MTRKTRRILFYLGFAIFLFASYIAIVYAQGYKYSFKEKRFFRTGAIQLKVSDDVKVFVNDELDGTTSLFGNSHTVGSLLPGRYTIRLEREGFTPWQKAVDVDEGFITDFPRIIILPTSEEEAPNLLIEFEEIFASPAIVVATVSATPSPTPRISPRASGSPSPSPSPSPTPTPFPEGSFVLQNKSLYYIENGILQPYAVNVLGYSISENDRKILWWTARDVWVGWLRDSDYQPYKKNGDRELVIHFATPIKRAAWFRGEDHILVDSNGFKIVELDKRGGQNIIRL